MAELIYLLCAATSVVCAALLVRGWRRSRSPLLLWSSACFALLALNNLLLVADLILFVTQVDLAVVRSASALAAVLVLLAGLIWERR